MRGAFTTALLLLFFVLQPLAAMAAEKVFDVYIEQRKLVQPGASLRVVKGDAVTLRWHSDEAVKLHMHGYDIELDVTANKPAEMHFDASINGRYPVTSHGFGAKQANQHTHGHEALLYIEVYPE